MVDTSVPGWPGDLFIQRLAEALAASRDLRRDQRLGLVRETSERLQGSEVPSWVSMRVEEMEQHIWTLNVLLNSIAADAFGAGGQAPDTATIEVVARQLGRLYRDLLLWSLRARKAGVPASFREALDEVALLPEQIIGQIESLGPQLESELREARSKPGGMNGAVIRVRLSVEVPNVDRVITALRRAGNRRE